MNTKLATKLIREIVETSNLTLDEKCECLAAIADNYTTREVIKNLKCTDRDGLDGIRDAVTSEYPRAVDNARHHLLQVAFAGIVVIK